MSLLFDVSETGSEEVDALLISDAEKQLAVIKDVVDIAEGRASAELITWVLAQVKIILDDYYRAVSDMSENSY